MDPASQTPPPDTAAGAAATGDALIHFSVGSFKYACTLGFLASLILSILVVVVFGLRKFNDRLDGAPDSSDLLTQILPSYLTSSGRYYRSLFLYVFLLVPVVVLIAIGGPRFLQVGGDETVVPSDSVPLLTALIIVGLVPNVPWVRDIEKAIRQFCHDRAFIPGAVRTLADRLNAATFDFSIYKEAYAAKLPAFRGVEPTDFTAARGTPEYRWAKLACLIHQLNQARDEGLADMDRQVFRQYSSDVDRIIMQRKVLDDDMGAYRLATAAGGSAEVDKLMSDIGIPTWNALIFLASAIRERLPREPYATLRPLGFVFNRGGTLPRRTEIPLTAAFVAAIVVLLVESIAVAVRRNIPGLLSDPMPNGTTEPFIYAGNALIFYGLPMLVAHWLRSWKISKQRWFTDGGQRRQWLNYIVVGLLSSVASLVGLIALAMFMGLPLRVAAPVTAPFGLFVGLWTGLAYLFHLDNVELNCRPNRAFEILLQAFATGTLGLLATAITTDTDLPTTARLTYMIFSASLFVFVGAALGIFVPSAAAGVRAAHAKQPSFDTQLAAIRAEAVRMLGNDEAADQWLNETNQSLGGRPPRQALSDADGFDKVFLTLVARARSLTQDNVPPAGMASQPG
jgi:hypothetical protein